jgi:hypothetical protein
MSVRLLLLAYISFPFYYSVVILTIVKVRKGISGNKRCCITESPGQGAASISWLVLPLFHQMIRLICHSGLASVSRKSVSFHIHKVGQIIWNSLEFVMKKIHWARGATASLSEGQCCLLGVESTRKYTCKLMGERFTTVFAHFPRVFRREDCSPSNFDSFFQNLVWGKSQKPASLPLVCLLSASFIKSSNLVKLWKVTGLRCRLQRQWCSWTRRFFPAGVQSAPRIKASLCGVPQRSGQPRPSVHGWHSSPDRQRLDACNRTRVLGGSYLTARLYGVA